MEYNLFKGKNLSRLGFGFMRLPLNDNDEINVSETEKMIKYAIDKGINYFDTARPYHKGKSEEVVGKILSKFDRDSFNIADKYPGHQFLNDYNPEPIFEKQLELCKVKYFDFYLLHNVYEESIKIYKDDKLKILDYFKKQREKGRIKHLGFSTHGMIDCLEEFLDYVKGEMEFCQIQFNYLDYSLQDAKLKYDLLTKRDIPIWVMEPLRGGSLVNLDDAKKKKFNNLLSENISTQSIAFDFIRKFDNIKVILSGMSSMHQLIDNVNIFLRNNLLTNKQIEEILVIADELKDSILCTQCKYCINSCPQKLNIPKLISIYNDIKFSIKNSLTPSMILNSFDENEMPDKCIKCGNCKKMCPQKIDIPNVLSKLHNVRDKLPNWRKMCDERRKYL